MMLGHHGGGFTVRALEWSSEIQAVTPARNGAAQTL